MSTLTEAGRNALNDIAARYGVSFDAAEHLLMAVIAGQTTQAQFNHPELGGMGQWSQGGMIMIGDMFNNSLKAKVDGLCSELAALVRNANLHFAPAQQQSQSQYQGHGASLFVPGSHSQGNWWPEELGQAASVGSQNDLRYAYFPSSRRLAINIGGRVTVYDTGDHQIGGFSQQQGGDQSLTFTSQHGLVRVSDLDIAQRPEDQPADVARPAQAARTDTPQRGPTIAAPEPTAAPPQQPTPVAAPQAASEDDIFTKIERLAALHAKGILTDREFSDKKAELLSRL